MGIVLCCIILTLFILNGAFFTHPSTNYLTYVESPSAVHVGMNKNATADSINVRVNALTNASDPATRDTWVRYNVETKLDNTTLAPPQGLTHLVANITITNTGHSAIPCRYTDFALVARDGSMYYANYAVGDNECYKNLLVNQTLSRGFSDEVYILFSVPSTTSVTACVYSASNSPIVVSIA